MSDMPFYDLSIVQEIALDLRKCRPTKKVINWLDNHGYRKRFVQDIILALRDTDHRKTTQLEHLPETHADIYNLDYEGEEWYVKLFIDSDTGQIVVRIWSCWWDSVSH